MLIDGFMGNAHGHITRILTTYAFGNFFRRPLQLQFLIYILLQERIALNLFWTPTLLFSCNRALMRPQSNVAPTIFHVILHLAADGAWRSAKPSRNAREWFSRPHTPRLISSLSMRVSLIYIVAIPPW